METDQVAEVSKLCVAMKRRFALESYMHSGLLLVPLLILQVKYINSEDAHSLSTNSLSKNQPTKFKYVIVRHIKQKSNRDSKC